MLRPLPQLFHPALISPRGIVSSETSSHDRPDDIEGRMRRSLGLLGTTPVSAPTSSPADDPLRGARQAIRSQAAAREYVERQLVHAEATIEDLRGKLHHARRDKDAAIEAARSAAARKVAVERSLAATESALATEKAARDRSDRALREAQATISHLQVKLDAAAETAKAELAAERQVRQKAETAPRQARKMEAPTKAISPKVRTASPSANDQMPVQWWVEGWNRRRR